MKKEEIASKMKKGCERCGSSKHKTSEHRGRQEFKPQDDFSEKDEKKEKSERKEKGHSNFEN